MTAPANHFVRFAQRPEGAPTPACFALDSGPVPELSDGEFLLRNNFLSMDPALVGRMRAESNYMESAKPGEVMHAYGIGQVLASRHPDVTIGELRLGRIDMQEFSLHSDASETTVINLGLADPEAYLSVVGITGATAYFALADICKPQPGETVLISSAASSVGAVAAQLARKAGAHTVGIVSTPEKAELARRDWGYDSVVSYRGRSIAELAEALAVACPDGVDVYFDNTSGDISEAVLDLYNEQARIAVIGRVAIAHLADTREDIGRRDNNTILAKRITKRGFVLLDHRARMAEAILELASLVHRGELKFHVDMAEGIAQTPEAFFRMLSGRSKGKQLVRLAPIDDSTDPANRVVGRLLRSGLVPVAPLLRLANQWFA